MGQMKVKAGGQWYPVGGGGATVDPDEPVNPMIGQIWHDTDEAAPPITPYYCHLEQIGGGQSLAIGNNFLTWDGVKSDDFAMFNGTNGIIIPASGLYLVWGILGITTSNTGLLHWDIRVNDVHTQTIGRGAGDTPNPPLVWTGSAFLFLKAGDLIQVNVYTSVARTTSTYGPMYNCQLAIYSITSNLMVV